MFLLSAVIDFYLSSDMGLNVANGPCTSPSLPRSCLPSSSRCTHSTGLEATICRTRQLGCFYWFLLFVSTTWTASAGLFIKTVRHADRRRRSAACLKFCSTSLGFLKCLAELVGCVSKVTQHIYNHHFWRVNVSLKQLCCKSSLWIRVISFCLLTKCKKN